MICNVNATTTPIETDPDTGEEIGGEPTADLSEVPAEYHPYILRYSPAPDGTYDVTIDDRGVNEVRLAALEAAMNI